MGMHPPSSRYPSYILPAMQNKLTLHLVSAYVNILAASSYAMLWTGYSPILPDVQSCL